MNYRLPISIFCKLTVAGCFCVWFAASLSPVSADIVIYELSGVADELATGGGGDFDFTYDDQKGSTILFRDPVPEGGSTNTIDLRLFDPIDDSSAIFWSFRITTRFSDNSDLAVGSYTTNDPLFFDAGRGVGFEGLEGTLNVNVIEFGLSGDLIEFDADFDVVSNLPLTGRIYFRAIPEPTTVLGLGVFLPLTLRRRKRLVSQ